MKFTLENIKKNSKIVDDQFDSDEEFCRVKVLKDYKLTYTMNDILNGIIDQKVESFISKGELAYITGWGTINSIEGHVDLLFPVSEFRSEEEGEVEISFPFNELTESLFDIFGIDEIRELQKRKFINGIN